MYSQITIRLNGKTAYTVKNLLVYTVNAKLLTLSNGKTFLWLQGAGDNGDGTNQILAYDRSSGKFKCLADFESIFGKYAGHITTSVKSVEGKKIKISVSCVSKSLGMIQFTTTFSYKSGTLKQANTMTSCKVLNAGKKHNTLTANKRFKTYASKSLSGKTYTVRKNQKVTISGFCLKGSKFMYKMRVNGKTRWKAFSKKYPSKWLFKDVYYAG